MSDYTIRPATLADVRYMTSLCDANAHCLGFVPPAQIEAFIEKRLGLTAWLNDERCGLLLTNGLKDTGKIMYTCIQEDARRREHATVLVDEYKRRLLRAGCHEMRLRCRSDLEANLFWRSIGMDLVGTYQPPTRQTRPLLQYQLILRPEERLWTPDQQQTSKIDQLSLWPGLR